MKKINLIIAMMVLAYSTNAQQWPWRLQSFVPYDLVTGFVRDSFEYKYSGQNGGDDTSMMHNPFDRLEPFADWNFSAYDSMRIWDMQSTTPYLGTNYFTAVRTATLVKIGGRNNGTSTQVAYQEYVYDVNGRKKEYRLYNNTGTKIWVSKYGYNSSNLVVYNTHEGEYGSSTTYMKRDSIAYIYNASNNFTESVRFIWISGAYYEDTRELAHYISGTNNIDTLWNFYGYSTMGQWYVQKYFTYKYDTDGVIERLEFSQYDDIQTRGRYEYDNGKRVKIYQDDYDTWNDTFINRFYTRQDFDTAGNRVHSLYGIWNSSQGYYDTVNHGGIRYNYEYFDTTQPTSVVSIASPEIILYPNPATTQVNVRANFKTTNIRVEIYNTTGQLVRLVPNGKLDNGNLVIPLNDMLSATYRILIYDGDTRLYGSVVIE